MVRLDGFCGVLDRLTRLFGDVNAVGRGRVPRRIGRRTAGKPTGLLLGELFR